MEVGNADAEREALLDERLHGGPGLVDGRIRRLDLILAIVGPAGWVSDLGVHVFQSHREVDVEEVEVVDAPVGQLLSADWFYLVTLVERVP